MGQEARVQVGDFSDGCMRLLDQIVGLLPRLVDRTKGGVSAHINEMSPACRLGSHVIKQQN